MFCHHCGSKLPEDSVFCHICGTKIIVQENAPETNVTPIQPVQPVQPAQPVQQFQPVQPAQPVQQFQPAQPAQPVQQFQPVQYVQPTSEAADYNDTFRGNNARSVPPSVRYAPASDGTAARSAKTKKSIMPWIKIIITILIAVLLIAALLFFWNKNKYINAVKQYRPYDSNDDLNYTFGEVVDKYVGSVQWESEQINDTSYKVKVNGELKDSNGKFYARFTVEPQSADSYLIHIESISIGDNKFTSSDSAETSMYNIYCAYSKGDQSIYTYLKENHISNDLTDLFVLDEDNAELVGDYRANNERLSLYADGTAVVYIDSFLSSNHYFFFERGFPTLNLSTLKQTWDYEGHRLKFYSKYEETVDFEYDPSTDTILLGGVGGYLLERAEDTEKTNSYTGVWIIQRYESGHIRSYALVLDEDGAGKIYYPSDAEYDFQWEIKEVETYTTKQKLSIVYYRTNSYFCTKSSYSDDLNMDIGDENVLFTTFYKQPSSSQ